MTYFDGNLSVSLQNTQRCGSEGIESPWRGGREEGGTKLSHDTRLVEWTVTLTDSVIMCCQQINYLAYHKAVLF